MFDGKPEGILTLTLCTGEVRCCSSSPPSVYMISYGNPWLLCLAPMVPKAGVEPAPSALSGRRTTCCAISAYRPETGRGLFKPYLPIQIKAISDPDMKNVSIFPSERVLSHKLEYIG